MHPVNKGQALRLEDIPNIGKSIASDLRAVGILDPQQLAAHEPMATYFALAERTGHRHDPCVLYVLLAAQHYLRSGESLPWWSFTAAGKQLLAAHAHKHRALPGVRPAALKQTRKH